MNRDSLIAAGFKESKSNHSALERWDWLYQKRIRDENGTRYFIEVMFYQHLEHDGYQVEINYNDGCAFHPKAFMRILLYGEVRDWTPDELLRVADELWQRLAPNYYERDN